MKILFICTAYNSLCQRLALELAERGGHKITVEYALSPQIMVEAVQLAQPDLVLCPFLTKRIPAEVYTKYMTLIVHPGPPCDEGPSALDWVLMGDRGEVANADQQLAIINTDHLQTTETRSHWGVTVLQAVEAFDAGPVWAFDQFELSSMTKSCLYRGPVTKCALNAVLAALHRVQLAHTDKTNTVILPTIEADPTYRQVCVSLNKPFLGGKTYNRPLLKAAARDFVPLLTSSPNVRLGAKTIVQRIRSADSQPGVLSTLFGKGHPLFLYDAHVQYGALPNHVKARSQNGLGTVLATRQGAVLVDAGADFPIWIGLLRRPKAKTDVLLHPKLPALSALLSMPNLAHRLELRNVPEWKLDTVSWHRQSETYQQIWIETEILPDTDSDIAYVYTEFYNGAFSTSQCQLFLQALRWVVTQPRVKAVVMMGGSGYFSNGIALNVIEGSHDSPAEGWANINAIDDCVQTLLAPKGIITFSALRGNAAAGGLALATVADFVLCAEHVVLNPHYRSLGLYGSEWHTYSWYQRCGKAVAEGMLRDMLPISAHRALRIGLVDRIIPDAPGNLVTRVKDMVRAIMTSDVQCIGAPWTKPSAAASSVKWPDSILINKHAYLTTLFSDPKATSDQLEHHLLQYRQRELAEMQLDFFHPYRSKRFAERCTAFVRKIVPTSTPTRFATHRRNTGDVQNLDIEERDSFDTLGDVPASEATPRFPVEQSTPTATSSPNAVSCPSTAPTSPTTTLHNLEPEQSTKIQDKVEGKSGRKVQRFLQHFRRRSSLINPQRDQSKASAPQSKPETLWSCYFDPKTKSTK